MVSTSPSCVPCPRLSLPVLPATPVRMFCKRATKWGARRRRQRIWFHRIVNQGLWVGAEGAGSQLWTVKIARTATSGGRYEAAVTQKHGGRNACSSVVEVVHTQRHILSLSLALSLSLSLPPTHPHRAPSLPEVAWMYDVHPYIVCRRDASDALPPVEKR